MLIQTATYANGNKGGYLFLALLRLHQQSEIAPMLKGMKKKKEDTIKKAEAGSAKVTSPARNARRAFRLPRSRVWLGRSCRVAAGRCRNSLSLTWATTCGGTWSKPREDCQRLIVGRLRPQSASTYKGKFACAGGLEQTVLLEKTRVGSALAEKGKRGEL